MPSKSVIFLQGMVSGAGVQITSFILGMVSVPVGLSYLGPIQYGVWIVISSIVAYFGLSQFGIGTASAALIAKNDQKEVQGLIFQKSSLLLCYCSLFFIILTGMVALFPEAWVAMFGNIPSDLQRDATFATIVLVLLTLLRLPTIAVSSAFFGLQEVWLERLYVGFFPAVFNFLALLITIYFKGGLVMLAYLTGIAQLLVGLLASLHFYLRHSDMLIRHEKLDPDKDPTKGIFLSGSRFFIIGIASMVVWYTDIFIISYYLGPESVTAYSVTFKLFTAALSVFMVANMVLMPMFGNSAGKGDWVWVNDIYKVILPINIILGGLIWIVGIVFAESIILMWTGTSGFAGALVVFSLGGYAYILSSVNLNSSILSGMNLNRNMLWIGIAEAVLNFVLSMTFVRFFGIGGVALGTFISALLTVFWLLPTDLEKQTHLKLKITWSPIVSHFMFAIFPCVVTAYFLIFIAHGIVLWVLGSFLCATYLVISFYLLPEQLKNMFLKISKKNYFNK